MSFEKKIKSPNSQVIKTALLQILDTVTEPEVLACDRDFYQAEDKHRFLGKFETAAAEKPAALLEKWIHYCWLRLEISYLANQKAALNSIQLIKQDTLNAFSNNETISALANSVNCAVQEDFLNGVTISQSINVLRRMILQVVGTEHPTDPLSQTARDLLTKLGNAISDTPDENTIKQIMQSLASADSIPPFRRDVAEEVNRNIHITLDKLYETLPYLIDSILNAYQLYYGDALYQQHENEILVALEGGLQPDGSITKPIVRDASWAGFDADGNSNMKPDVMRYAIRLHRIRSAEKHSEVLNKTLIKISKDYERKLRNEMSERNILIFDNLVDVTDVGGILKQINKLQNLAMQAVVDKKFGKVLDLFKDQRTYINLIPNVDKEKMNALRSLVDQQLQTAAHVIQLTAFSGEYRTDKESIKGALQKLDRIFRDYKAAIRDDTDAIEILERNATDYVIDLYNVILTEHKDLLNIFPELKRPMRHFGIQLRCYGMTYGVGHIRQDSSIFTRVWETLLEDLKGDQDFEHRDVLQLINTKKYSKLSPNDKLALQKLLQDKQYGILNYIYKKNYARKYHDLALAHPNSDYSWVCSELERIEVALRHRDMFENIIISNSECAANIFEVESLMRVFPTFHSDLVIVPLLEKRLDLENYEAILTDMIKIRIQDKLRQLFNSDAAPLQAIFNCSTLTEITDFVNGLNRHTFKEFLHSHPTLRPILQTIVVEVMVGYSDTERVSGLAALISIQQVQEDIMMLTADFGVAAKLYHGGGGDVNRGGLRRRDEKGTLQGNARSNVLNTPEATQRFRETQFYLTYKLKSDPKNLMEFTNLPHYIHDWIKECKDDGAYIYEHLHDTENGIGKLFGFMLGRGPHWLVTMLNSSSRATQRGIAENHGDRTASVQTGGIRPESYIHPDKPRAITATQLKEVLRDYIGVLVGPGYGLKKLGKEKALKIFDSSQTVRDMFFKVLIGLTLSDLSFLQHALFANHPQLIPASEAETLRWAKDFEHDFEYLAILLNQNAFADPDDTLLMFWLSRLFAYINAAVIETKNFMFDLMHSIYLHEYHEPAAMQSTQTTNLLLPFPEWKQQTENTIHELMPLSYLLARQNIHVVNGVNLDELYHGLNDTKVPHSKLTGVGRLLGDLGAGITAGRIMMPGYYDNIYLNYQDNLRRGVARADRERNGAPIDRNRLFAVINKDAFEQEISRVVTLRRAKTI